MLTLSVASRDQTNFGKLLPFLEVRAGRPTPGFPKTFLEGYRFVFVEYLCNRTPKV